MYITTQWLVQQEAMGNQISVSRPVGPYSIERFQQQTIARLSWNSGALRLYIEFSQGISELTVGAGCAVGVEVWRHCSQKIFETSRWNLFILVYFGPPVRDNSFSCCGTILCTEVAQKKVGLELPIRVVSSLSVVRCSCDYQLYVYSTKASALIMADRSK